MTSMSFDDGRPLDVGISKRLKTFNYGFEELHTSRTNSIKVMKILKGVNLPHEKVNIGVSNGGDDVVSSLLYDMFLDITIMHMVNI